MMSKYASLWDDHLERFSVAKHRIHLNLPDAPPIHETPHRTGPQQQQLKKEETEQVLKFRVAEPATTEWASPTVVVLKKDKSLRLSVDNRLFNAETVRDSYLVPIMDESKEALGEARIVLTLDANSS